MKALIERAQPYNTMPQVPARHALEQLRLLSNVDKHRTLATVVAAVSNQFVGVRADIDVRWEQYMGEIALGHDETEVAVLLATSETEFEATEVNPAFTYEVRIETLPVSALVSIAQRVFEAVTEVETGEPISPFAAYPISPGF